MKIIKLDAIDSTNSYLKKLLNKESLDDINEFIEKSIQYIFNKNYD